MKIKDGNEKIVAVGMFIFIFFVAMNFINKEIQVNNSRGIDLKVISENYIQYKVNPTVYSLSDLQKSLDVARHHIPEKLNCLYSFNCNMPQGFLNEMETYISEYTDRVSNFQIAYNITLFLQLVLAIFMTKFIRAIIKNKRNYRISFLTIEQLRERIVHPIISEILSDEKISINRSIVYNVNRLDKVSRIVVSSTKDIIVETSAIIDCNWMEPFGDNKYIIKNEILSSKVA
jgi:hypothetical protein